MTLTNPNLHAADYQAMGEAELVGRARRGEREAFRAIMQRCNQRLFRIARSVVRDDVEAEDVLQEAYVRAFSAIGRFRGEAGILTWLTRITLNEARGRLRRRRTLVDIDEIEAAQSGRGQVLAFPSAGLSADPEADAARAQMRRLLESAVDELPDAFRTVFIMRDVEECSIEETAINLGIRPETVKTRLHRARRQLRKTLDEKLSASLGGAFPFLGLRCQAITERVLARMAPQMGWDGASPRPEGGG
jgi:RNA polymerase sigma-70 factor (ECF subfamily)